MYQNISSTDLKQRTREVLEIVEDKGEPIVIETYGKPKAVLISIENWERETKKPSIEELKKYMFKSKVKDTTKYFRKLRNAEVRS